MRITEAESQVMDALWRQSPLTTEALLADVRGRQAWGDATIKTLINRLLRKKAIASERLEGRHGYRPLVGRGDYLEAESQDLLDRLFGGDLSPLVSHFAERRKLSPADKARLKRLVEELGDDA
ncbi:MAG: BlaI family transcriptional regulator [Caulobacter sp.]|nr:BlaI family transcriptional regulator [Caulobacter sp.]